MLTAPINGPRPADEKAPRKRRGVGRPRRSVSGELVPKEHAMRDRFLVAPARPGKIVSARLVYKNGNYRLVVTLSWKQGEFTVTGYDNYWRDLEALSAPRYRPAATIDKHNQHAGRLAVELLLERITGNLGDAATVRTIEPEPWSLGVRFQEEPEGLHRYQVTAGSAADGVTVDDLPCGEDAWVSFVIREGRLVPVRGDTEIRAGDEVLVLADDASRLDVVFTQKSDNSPELRQD